MEEARPKSGHQTCLLLQCRGGKPGRWYRVLSRCVRRFATLVHHERRNLSFAELQDFVAQFGDPLDLDGDSGDASDSASMAADVLQYVRFDFLVWGRVLTYAFQLE